MPNGKLSLRIRSYHSSLSRRVWSDGKKQRLEDVLGRFAGTLLALAESERLERIARERREADWERQRELSPDVVDR